MTDHPILLGPGEGEKIRTASILAGREELVLTEFNYPPNADGPKRHVHHHHADAFYVLEGQLRITLDEDDLVLEPGSFVFIPPEVIHAFGNPSDQPGRYLNLHAPGCGFDEYMRGNNPDFDQDYDVPPGSGRPTEDAVVIGPGEGEQLELGPSRTCVKAGVSNDPGSLAVLETTVAPGSSGPVLHVHDETVDSFFVLEGTITFQIDVRTEDADPGSFALVPPGTPHTFFNPREEPARVLNVMAPGGFEAYLREAAAGRAPQDGAKYDFRAI